MQPKHNFSDPSSLHKDCDFSLDLKAVVASDSDSSGLPSNSTQVSELEVAGSRWLGRFWRQSSHEKHVQPQDLIFNGTLSSGNCGIQLQINATTTHIEVYEAKAINYTFMVTALTFVQVRIKTSELTSSCVLQGTFWYLDAFKTYHKRVLLCSVSVSVMCCNLSHRTCGDAGVVTAEADGVHQHASHSKQGVAAHAWAAGCHRCLPLPSAPHYRLDHPHNMCHTTCRDA